MWKTALPAIAGLLFFSPMVAAQFARQEMLIFNSITISDNDFLQGKSDGKSVALAARLLLPKATQDSKQPAVVLLHGSGGVGGSGSPVSEWENELTRAGYA